MAQELSDKIRAAAQARGIDPEIALRIARAESAVNPAAQAKTSSAGGLFQVVDKTWKEFGGKPGKKYDPDENIRVGTDIIAKNTQTLRSFLNRDPRPAEVYAAHYFGPTGAKSFLSAEPGTPMESIFSKEVIRANPNLKGKTTSQVMASLEKKMGSSPAAPAPARQANVSRETPPQKFLEPNPLEPLAPAAQAPLAPANKLASLGPGYQAALALSFLADTDEKEDRDVEKEPGIAEKWLAESTQAPRPAALAEFSDISIKSPFAALEPQQPQMLADGGEVEEESYPDVGRPTVQETYMAKTMFPDLPVAEAVYLIRGGQRQSTPMGEMLSGNIGAMVPMGKDASAMLMLAGSRPERSMSESKALMAAFNKRVGDEGGLDINVVRPLDAPPGIFAGGMSASYPLGEGRISGNINALKLPGQDPRITGYGVGYGGRVGPGNLSAGLMKQKDGPYSGQIEYRLPIGRADGSPEEGERALTPQQIERLAEQSAQEPETESKSMLQQFYDADKDMSRLPRPPTSPLGLALTAGQYAYRYVTGTDPLEDLKNRLKKKLEEEVDTGDEPMEQIPKREGLPRVNRANGSPEEGEVARLTPQQIEQLLAREALEREKASSAAFLTPKSGIGRKISTQPGELEAAALQGVSEYPYLLAGSPVDLATMVMRPFGYDVEKPMFGSEDLKQRATDLGIRQKPPEGAAARALYEMTQLGASAVNPAAPVRGAVKAAEKVGDAARMLEDMTVGNIQRGKVRRAGAQAKNIPDTAYDPLRERMEASGNLAYAVRNKATPFVMTDRPDTSVDGFIMSMNRPETLAFREKYPDINFFDEAAMKTTQEYQNFTKPIDMAEYLVKYQMQGNYNQREMLKQDPTLEKWFSKAVPHYLRTDFASPEDPLVKAAEKGLLLHFEPKVLPRNFDPASVKNPIDKQSLAYTRETEGFPKSGMAKEDKTNFAKRVEDKIDSSVYPATVADIFNPAQIPPSLRNSVETNPEARVMDFSPDVLEQLQLPQLRDKMLEIRALGPKGEYSAYSQPAAKVPDEFLLPDKVLGMMNMATASNRVARFTRWQDAARQAMATTALRTDPRFERQPLQDGKFLAVVLPDPVKNPELKKLVTDVGCDGGWCTQGEKFAEDYGSGNSRLHVIVSGEGKQARPAAQFAVEEKMQRGSNNGVPFEIPKVSITEIKTAGNTRDFEGKEHRASLPAIQQYVQALDKQYGGVAFVDQLSELGMTQLPKRISMELLNMYGLSSQRPFANMELRAMFGSDEEGLKAVKNEMMKLNNGSQYAVGNKDDVAALIRQATRNVLALQQRATGGMIERQSTDNRRYL